MRLLAWKVGEEWSNPAHISHLGEPLCLAKIPDGVIAKSERAAKPQDWWRICKDCRVIATRAATRSIDADAEPRATHSHLTLIKGNA